MANTYYGKQILGELSDAQTLPNATAVDSTNMVYVGDNTNGKLWIDVYANTAISIANTFVLHIDLQGFTADTAASATAPFSTAGAVLANTTPLYRILSITASGGATVFAAGDLMTQCAIPEDLFALLSYDFVQLVYTTTANESAETVDAFVYSKM